MTSVECRINEDDRNGMGDWPSHRNQHFALGTELTRNNEKSSGDRTLWVRGCEDLSLDTVHRE
jgi:hypothetical protein